MGDDDENNDDETGTSFVYSVENNGETFPSPKPRGNKTGQQRQNHQLLEAQISAIETHNFSRLSSPTITPVSNPQVYDEIEISHSQLNSTIISVVPDLETKTEKTATQALEPIGTNTDINFLPRVPRKVVMTPARGQYLILAEPASPSSSPPASSLSLSSSAPPSHHHARPDINTKPVTGSFNSQNQLSLSGSGTPTPTGSAMPSPLTLIPNPFLSSSSLSLSNQHAYSPSPFIAGFLPHTSASSSTPHSAVSPHHHHQQHDRHSTSIDASKQESWHGDDERFSSINDKVSGNTTPAMTMASQSPSQFMKMPRFNVNSNPHLSDDSIKK